MKNIILEIKRRCKESSKNADKCSQVEYDCGFYVGKSEGFEEVLELLEDVNEELVFHKGMEMFYKHELEKLKAKIKDLI